MNEKRNEKKEGKKPVGAAILVLISHPHPNITDPCIPTILNEFSKENKLLCVRKENDSILRVEVGSNNLLITTKLGARWARGPR